MRDARSLRQAQTGARIGVNQKRLARIEAPPGITSFDRIARLVSALGRRVVIEGLMEQIDAKPNEKTVQKDDW